MQDNIKKISNLIVKFKQGRISEPELLELEAWKNASSANAAMFDNLLNDVHVAREINAWLEGGEKEQIAWGKLEMEGFTTVSLPRSSRVWIRYVAAATVLLLLGVSFWWLRSPVSKPTITKTQPIKQDIAPPPQKAVLTLADGSQVNLDEVASGTIAMEGTTKVEKSTDGSVIYNGTAATGYNTITVPRGSKVVNISLSDGSKVWLNAQSVIRYPVVFNGTMRELSVDGEAFFEVKSNLANPFIVKRMSGEPLAQVTGTEFNINTYESPKVTLVQGKLKVSNTLLHPGEQAQLSNADVNVVKDVDLEQVTGWKNGLFVFEGTPIKEIMKELERWYDVEASYEGRDKGYTVSGQVPRQSSISKVLEYMESTGGVHFNIEGRKIIVKF